MRLLSLLKQFFLRFFLSFFLIVFLLHLLLALLLLAVFLLLFGGWLLWCFGRLLAFCGLIAISKYQQVVVCNPWTLWHIDRTCSLIRFMLKFSLVGPHLPSSCLSISSFLGLNWTLHCCSCCWIQNLSHPPQLLHTTEIQCPHARRFPCPCQAREIVSVPACIEMHVRARRCKATIWIWIDITTCLGFQLPPVAC